MKKPIKTYDFFEVVLILLLINPKQKNGLL